MYLENLSSFLLKYIETNNISYEKLALMCEISPEFVGRIIRRQAVPTINIVEKICEHLKVSPNQILERDIDRQLYYRVPMKVKDVVTVQYITGSITYSICPRCKAKLSQRNQMFCNDCGQKLEWEF